MELIGYAVKSGFVDYMKKHTSILAQLSALSKEQCSRMIDLPNEQELCERAVQFFNNDAIYLKDHTIYYENKLKKATYSMRVDTYCIYLTPQEGNPFLPFLQRIFRNLVICTKKDDM